MPIGCKKGILAVAPDLFSWGGRIRCIRALMLDLSARKERRSTMSTPSGSGLEAARIAPARSGHRFCATGGLRSFWRPARLFGQ